MKVILHIVFILGIAVPLALCQSGVCSYIVSGIQISYRITQESYITYYSCGPWEWSTCSRTAYRSIGIYYTHVVYHTETRCCSGYAEDGTQCSPICSDCTDREVCVAPEECVCSAGWTGENCTEAICSDCTDREVCVAPEECVCIAGWTGENCMEAICSDCTDREVCVAPEECVCIAGWTGGNCTEDVDECQSPDLCGHDCINTNGSYYCTCEEESVLATDQSSCIDSPRNIILTPTGFDTMQLSWEPPHLNDSAEAHVVHFVILCSSDSASFTTTVSDDSLQLDSLTPYTSYTCCLTADTTLGPSAAACETQITLESVPADPPGDMTVVVLSSTAAEMEWRSPQTPNGVILYYTIYIDGAPVSNVSASSGDTSATVNGLSPNRQITVSVSASTKIGEGPVSPEQTVTTHESFPGVVDSLEVVALSANLLRVSWEPPLSPNGVLTGYQVEVVNLIDSSESIYYVSPDVRQHNISNRIAPYVPYRVSVRARTSVGAGERVLVVIFTLEGVPQNAPIIVSAVREKAATAVIEWEELSWEDRRGVLTSYEIVYDDMTSDQCPATNSFDNTLSVNEGSLNFVITDLYPGLQYCVGVAAKTSAGIGEFSFKVIPWYTNNVFTVAVDTESCTQWILTTPSEKMEDLVQEISKAIEQFCRCEFTGDYIAEERLTCNKRDPHLVLLQGRIIGTNDRDSSDLLVNLEEWVSSGPTVMIQGKELRVVSSETSPDASSDNQQEDSKLSVTVVGAIAATLSVVVITIIIIIGVVYCRYKRRYKSEVTVHELAGSTERDSAATDRYSHSLSTLKAANYETPGSNLKEIAAQQDYEAVDRYSHGLLTLKTANYETPDSNLKETAVQQDYEIPEVEEENIYEDPDTILEKVKPTFSQENNVANKPTYDDVSVTRKPRATAKNPEIVNATFGLDNGAYDSTISTMPTYDDVDVARKPRATAKNPEIVNATFGLDNGAYDSTMPTYDDVDVTKPRATTTMAEESDMYIEVPAQDEEEVYESIN